MAGLAKLPADKRIVSYCFSGQTASWVTSALRMTWPDRFPNRTPDYMLPVRFSATVPPLEVDPPHGSAVAPSRAIHPFAQRYPCCPYSWPWPS